MLPSHRQFRSQTLGSKPRSRRQFALEWLEKRFALDGAAWAAEFSEPAGTASELPDRDEFWGDFARTLFEESPSRHVTEPESLGESVHHLPESDAGLAATTGVDAVAAAAADAEAALWAALRHAVQQETTAGDAAHADEQLENWRTVAELYLDDAYAARVGSSWLADDADATHEQAVLSLDSLSSMSGQKTRDRGEGEGDFSGGVPAPPIDSHAGRPLPAPATAPAGSENVGTLRPVTPISLSAPQLASLTGSSGMHSAGSLALHALTLESVATGPVAVNSHALTHALGTTLQFRALSSSGAAAWLHSTLRSNLGRDSLGSSRLEKGSLESGYLENALIEAERAGARTGYNALDAREHAASRLSGVGSGAPRANVQRGEKLSKYNVAARTTASERAAHSAGARRGSRLLASDAAEGPHASGLLDVAASDNAHESAASQASRQARTGTVAQARRGVPVGETSAAWRVFELKTFATAVTAVQPHPASTRDAAGPVLLAQDAGLPSIATGGVSSERRESATSQSGDASELPTWGEGEPLSAWIRSGSYVPVSFLVIGGLLLSGRNHRRKPR
jgi:hypothetical protein